MTTETMNIHQKMLEVMKAISYVQKGEKTVNNQYRFVSHDAVTAIVREQLVAQGIVTTTSVLKHSQDGNRTEVDVIVELINADKPSDRIAINAFGYGIDPQDKGPGKAISYAVKYAYLKAFALETGDDPERDSIDHKPAKPALSGKPGDEGRALYEAMSDEEKDYIQSYAKELRKLHDAKAEDADLFLYTQRNKLDQEESLALWHVLQPDSGLRSAIKRGKTTAQLVTQP